ncbi:hypothetical protein ACJX0J_033855, partial [Zea mays]
MSPPDNESAGKGSELTLPQSGGKHFSELPPRGGDWRARRRKGPRQHSISGRKLTVARPSARAAAVVAKYGDKSVYFDLNDIGNTTG